MNIRFIFSLFVYNKQHRFTVSGLQRVLRVRALTGLVMVMSSNCLLLLPNRYLGRDAIPSGHKYRLDGAYFCGGLFDSPLYKIIVLAC